MIPSLLALLAGPTMAQDEPEPPPPADEGAPELDDELSRYRTPFDVLAERAIGTTSQPVEFNWRRTSVQLAAAGHHLFELNNFNSLRTGGLVRLPGGGLIFELELTYVETWDTPSSRLLSLTPYRQPGRPNRLELDFAVGIPLAEGVVTTAPKFFPAAQLVFNVYAGFRYAIYPAGWNHMQPSEVGGAIFSPSITELELDNLDDNRLDAMQIDLGRYGLMLGFGNDLYFKQGLFVSPRFMLAVPLLAPATQTDLLLWADLSLAIGIAL